MRRFLRCSIRTVARHSPAQADSLLNLVPAIDLSEITQISSLPRVDISPGNMMDMAQMLNGAWQQQQQQPAAAGGMQMGGIAGPFPFGPVHLPPVIANVNPLDPNNPLNNNNLPIPPQLLQLMASLQRVQQSSQDQDDDNVAGTISSWNTLHTLGVDFKSIQNFGFCSHVRGLSLPTFDMRVRHAAVLTELLPNLMSLHFQHVHPQEVMTGDRPRALFTPIPYAVLRCFAPLIARIVKLTAEDVYIPCWTELLRILKTSLPLASSSSGSTSNQRSGLAIKSLNLEAVATTDSFDSDEKLASVFANLPHLEAARFDGIAVGTDAAFLTLTRSCMNLSVIAVDYCPLVTMSAFNILWNNAPNLVFLGMAGIVNDQHLHHLLAPILHPNSQPVVTATATHANTPLVTHTKLRVLRLVDCDVTDTLCAHIAASAPNLDMLRIVFEDDACEGILRVVESLTDAALLAFTTRPAPARRMFRLAVTWCPAFTADALREVVRVCGVEVLDLHKDAMCELGLLPDSVLTECLGDGGLAGVKVLNLYGQSQMRDDTLRCISRHSMPVLTSLCINDTTASLTTLHHLLQMRQLTSLSALNCPNLTLEGVKEVFSSCYGYDERDTRHAQSRTMFSPLRQFYSEHCWNMNPATTPSASTAMQEDEGEDWAENDTEMDLDEVDEELPTLRSSRGGGKSGTASALPGHRGSKVTEEEDVEPKVILHDDMWFVDEGLDIMSLWSE
ncbi:hypothetical protein BC830DRAFT_1234579, partial [Chytriomyces sp. MP71]